MPRRSSRRMPCSTAVPVSRAGSATRRWPPSCKAPSIKLPLPAGWHISLDCRMSRLTAIPPWLFPICKSLPRKNPARRSRFPITAPPPAITFIGESPTAGISCAPPPDGRSSAARSGWSRAPSRRAKSCAARCRQPENNGHARNTPLAIAPLLGCERAFTSTSKRRLTSRPRTESALMTAITVDAAVRPRRSFQEVWVISLGHALTHWYPGTFYLLLPLIGKELGLSYSEIGSVPRCQDFAAAIANIRGGIFVDSVGRKGLLMAASLFWIGFPYLIMGFTHSYWMILCCATLVGIGNNLWHPSAIPWLANRFPQRKGLVMSI